MKSFSKFNLRTTRIVLASVIAAGGIMFGVNSYATDATGSMAVSASVAASCTISAADLAFGAYDPFAANASGGSDLTSSAALTLTCTNGASTMVKLGQGANADTGSTDAVPVRRLKSGANYLAYQLYSDSGRTTVWENTTGVSYTGTGAADSATLVVYGAVTKGQNASVGTYADTVVATVTF